MFSPDILERAARIVEKLSAAHLKVTTAESCTGGLIAGALTSITGSSKVLDQGFVTYANSAKSKMIGVDADLIATHGAVSAEVGRAMADGALKTAAADVAVSVTGIAGPGGGSPDKPVGLVFIGLASRNAPTRVERFDFGDIGRQNVRLETVREALQLLETAAG